MSGTLKQRLFDWLCALPTVDAHEHLVAESERLKRQVDALYLFAHYNKGDLISAGMSQKDLDHVLDTERPLQPRWKKFRRYWPAIKTGAYSRAVRIVIRDLFGIEELNDQTYKELSRRIAARNKPGWYREVLREKTNLLVSIQHVHSTKVDPELFVPVMHVAAFTGSRTRQQMDAIAKEFDCPVDSLDDLVAALEKAVAQWKQEGCVGLKVGDAYWRTLEFGSPTKHQAAVAFNRAVGHTGGPGFAEVKPLFDYMMNEVCRVGAEMDLVVVIHTGLQAGNYGRITDTNPVLLWNILRQHPQTRFDIFHGGYPYVSECGVMGKYFPNVWLNMAWMHIISPSASRRALREWIETVPGTKLIGFGGDYSIVEKVYAHCKMAREDIAHVLAELVEEGYFGLQDALELGERLMRTNPAELYKLEA